jgi:hypothetical protein
MGGTSLITKSPKMERTDLFDSTFKTVAGVLVM